MLATHNNHDQFSPRLRNRLKTTSMGLKMAKRPEPKSLFAEK